MMREFLRHAGPLVLFGLIAELVVALVAFAAILGLRFLRRGDARFGVSPAMAALALAPTALGTATAIAGFRNTLQGIMLTGSGGVAALAAGSAESLIPLALGLLLTAGLGFVALCVTALGSSKASAEVPGRGLTLPLFILLLAAFTAVLMVAVTGLVTATNAGLHDPAALLLMMRLATVAAGVLVFLLFAGLVASLVRLPRGAASLPVKLLCLLLLLGIWLGPLLAALAVFGQLSALSEAALTGEPYEGRFGAMARDAAARLGAHVEPRPLVVSVAGDGTYRIGRQPAAAAELKPRLAAAHDEGPPKLALRIDGEAPYATVVAVIEAADNAGWDRLTLIARGERCKVRIGYVPNARERQSPIFVNVAPDNLDVNKGPVASLEELDLRLRDILQTRYSKTVFLVPKAATTFAAWARVAQAMSDAGAEPALMTPAEVAAYAPPPPPPPPPPRTR